MNPSQVATRTPMCARCRNHSIKSPLKGHKANCKFKDCTDNKCHCWLVSKRQKIMAKQQKRKDKQQKIPKTIIKNMEIEFNNKRTKNYGKHDFRSIPNLAKIEEPINYVSTPIPPMRSITVRQKRNPMCARCQNHNIFNKLKNHKRFCEKKNCVCFKCMLTKEKQQIMALQVALRRQQQQDEERGKEEQIRNEEFGNQFIEIRKNINIKRKESYIRDTSVDTLTMEETFDSMLMYWKLIANRSDINFINNQDIKDPNLQQNAY